MAGPRASLVLLLVSAAAVTAFVSSPSVERRRAGRAPPPRRAPRLPSVLEESDHSVEPSSPGVARAAAPAAAAGGGETLVLSQPKLRVKRKVQWKARAPPLATR